MTCVARGAKVVHILVVNPEREMLAPVTVVVLAMVAPFELRMTKMSHGVRVRAPRRCPVAECAKVAAVMFHPALKRSAWLYPFQTHGCDEHNIVGGKTTAQQDTNPCTVHTWRHRKCHSLIVRASARH